MKKNFEDPKLGPNLGFWPFFQFASSVFLDIAQDCSLGQCLTSSRAETSSKKFCGPNWGQNDLFCANVNNTNDNPKRFILLLTSVPEY